MPLESVYEVYKERGKGHEGGFNKDWGVCVRDLPRWVVALESCAQRQHQLSEAVVVQRLSPVLSEEMAPAPHQAQTVPVHTRDV